jgi:DNA-directed RNA polymerase specialized sigma24 family protein
MSLVASKPNTPYEEHRSYVLGVIAGRCTWVPRLDREAVYHEAYLAMLELESAGRLDTAAMHPLQLRAYLAKAAVRKAFDDRKRAEHRLTVPLGAAAENRPDPGRPVDERVAPALDAKAVTELVAELPARQRAVWWCFGCQRGGRVYDLGSLLTGGPWGRDLRGEAFKAARELVTAALA